MLLLINHYQKTKNQPMKKLLTIVMLSCIFNAAKSQVYVQGGVNLANITQTKSGETQDNNLLTTFNAGILGRFNLSAPLDLETGLLIRRQGCKSKLVFYIVPQMIIM